MLIKRLIHRWMVMEGESGDGGAPAGGAAPAAPSSSDAGNAGGAGAGTSSDGSSASASSSQATATATGSDAAATGGDGKSPLGIKAAAIESPSSLASESTEAPKDGDKPAEATADSPIEYDDFKLPAGVALEGEALTAFKEAAASAKLNQDQAQQLVDMHIRSLQETLEASRKFNEEAWFKMSQQDRVNNIAQLISSDPEKQTEEAGALMPKQLWHDQTMADPDIGGTKFLSQTKPQMDAAIKAYCSTPESAKALREALTVTGVGNHPDVVRFFASVGAPLRPQHVVGKPTSGDGGKSAAGLLYPTHGAGNGGQS